MGRFNCIGSIHAEASVVQSGVRVVYEMDKKSYSTLAMTRSEKPDSAAKIFGRPKVQLKIEMKMTLKSNPRDLEMLSKREDN
jgi:hypothetical protein